MRDKIRIYIDRPYSGFVGCETDGDCFYPIWSCVRNVRQEARDEEYISEVEAVMSAFMHYRNYCSGIGDIHRYKKAMKAQSEYIEGRKRRR